ncbi:MAG: FAD:protein FMN transferase [Thermoanaerobaculia bacterium]
MGAEPALRRRARPLLGTLVEIEAGGLARTALDAAIDAAFAVVAEVQRRMSVHDPGSELSRANREAARHEVDLSPETAAVTAAALDFAAASGGAFDPTAGRHLVRSGLLPRPEKGRRYGRSSYHDVELRRFPDGSARIRFARPLLLDFGGIAKGYAVDRALAVLRAAGASTGLVNAGGDLACFGEVRTIGIRAPGDPYRIAATVELDGAAIATSSPDFGRRLRRGREVHPLVEPRSGDCFPERTSISVVAASCLVADALTKVALFAPGRFAAIAPRLGAEVIRLEAAAAPRSAGAAS